VPLSDRVQLPRFARGFWQVRLIDNEFRALRSCLHPVNEILKIENGHRPTVLRALLAVAAVVALITEASAPLQ
jgi:hypothetical protein